MLCPQCNSTLVLKQINFTEAVYICKNQSCSYPTKNSQCYVVQRKLVDLKKFNKNAKQQNVAATPPHDGNKDQDFDIDSLISSALMNLDSSSTLEQNVNDNCLPELKNDNLGIYDKNVSDEIDLEEIFNSLDNS